MRTATFFFLTLLLFTWKCKKPQEVGDLNGEEYIRGRLFLFDSIIQNVNGLPLGEKPVFLAYANSPDKQNYLFSTMTSKDGYFSFTNLNKDSDYRVYYEETVSNVKYTATVETRASIDTLRLNAAIVAPGQSGFQLTVIDEDKKPVKGASVCVFNSTFISGYANNDCLGNIYKLESNQSGKVVKIPLQEGTYYLNSNFGLNGFQISSKDTVQIIKDQIYFGTIKLKSPNGIRFVTTDLLDNRLPGASICLFTSEVLFAKDTCAGSNYQLTSTATGEVAIYDLPHQKYYIYCSYGAGDDKLVAHDTVDLDEHIKSVTLTLKQ